MTAAQEKAIARIRRKAESGLFHGGPEKYEFKKWEVEDCGSFISVVLEVGMKEDEGTMAELLCRDRAHLFIGRGGGITYPMYTKRSGSFTRRWNGVSILTPVIDQWPEDRRKEAKKRAKTLDKHREVC